MPRKAQGHLTKRRTTSKVAEVAVSYIVDRREGPAVSTISSKHQITLPAHLLRQMGLGPGDRLAVSLEGGRLVLRPRPQDWVSHYAGSLKGLYGASRQEMDAYARELREEGERDEAIERAWSGQKPAPKP